MIVVVATAIIFIALASLMWLRSLGAPSVAVGASGSVPAASPLTDRFLSAPDAMAGLTLARGDDDAATARHDGCDMPKVSVVVPALNEEQSIGWVIEHVPAWVSEIVLVDGLSVDGTELVVNDRRPDVVVVHQHRRGKGAALRAGFAAASGDIIVMIDADGSTDPREMERYVDALLDGADFAKGSRNLPGGGSVDFTRLRHWGNLAFVWAANLLFNVRFTDLCYGYCAFWARDLGRLDLSADGFEIEMELILSAVKTGMRLAEVPSMELERRAGASNLNAWADGKRVLRTLIHERLRRVDAAGVGAGSIALHPVRRAAHNTTHWVPAGSDRRHPLAIDRRQPTVTAEHLRRLLSGDRRVTDRRSEPSENMEVLVARPADGTRSAAVPTASASAPISAAGASDLGA